MRMSRLRPRSHRRGVTLIEMMVSVALLVMMMTILVTIFGSATGAVSGLQSYQQLDGSLRQLDMTIRKDLTGLTARLTPPLDPSKNLGYFEYGENAFADIQGEDTDDYIRFTAKAPEGQLFTGRVWTSLSSSTVLTPNSPQPTLITSQYAEIIYFLRNGNLYRRVLLVAPDRQTSVNAVVSSAGTTFYPTMFNPGVATISTSWQGVNDLSARPSPTATSFSIVLNTLGDLTNRENRAFCPRFANDFDQDKLPDDLNQDSSGNVVGNGVPDYYPTLYATVPSSLVWDATATGLRAAASTETMAFPYVYPGMYSQPDTFASGGNLSATTGAGWIHSLDPTPSPAYGGGAYTAPYLDQLMRLNHSPISIGDSVAPQASTSQQTWWGFPTWKETMSAGWQDPTVNVYNGVQPNGLHPFNAGLVPMGGANSSIAAKNFLLPMSSTYWLNPQPNIEVSPASTPTPVSSIAPTAALWSACWEDDLILTGVRSFDVKAYDNVYGGYVDLGWGDDLRIYPVSSRPASPPYLGSTPVTTSWLTGTYDTLQHSFAHEGRMPPLTTDLRLDANYPQPKSFYPIPPYPNYTGYTGNIGDNGTSVMRLRRVWDSWSTDYTQAPSNGFDPTTKLPIGPPWSPPVYPSYPPPYPAPLRGIQIQVRVTDPRGERVKVLTIRQDFSDKL